MIRREGDRYRGELTAECDDCGTSTDGLIAGVSDWHEFVRELKDIDWRVSKDDESGEYRHVCPDCNEE